MHKIPFSLCQYRMAYQKHRVWPSVGISPEEADFLWLMVDHSKCFTVIYRGWTCSDVCILAFHSAIRPPNFQHACSAWTIFPGLWENNAEVCCHEVSQHSWKRLTFLTYHRLGTFCSSFNCAMYFLLFYTLYQCNIFIRNGKPTYSVLLRFLLHGCVVENMYEIQ